ncbi:MAG: hypothetical protein CEE41_03685 [Hadesarchaea archaeon B3_Hades]|nr:MAG: hypothetical protein CEE41_03685 [Hadesarchaea archaeon B3_Hades]
MMDKIARACEKRPFVVIGVIALITVLMLTGIPKITTETEMRTFLPKGYPSIEATLEIENKFGGMQYEFILIKSQKVTNANVVRSLLDLQQKLVTEPTLENYVMEVGSYLDFLLPYIMVNSQLLPDNQLELTIQSLLAQPQIKNMVENKSITHDQKICLLSIRVNSNLKQSEASEKTGYFEDFVKSYASESGAFDASITGGYSISRDMQKMVGGESYILLLAAVIFIIVVLALAFRHASDVVSPFVVIGLAMVWVMGIMGHFGISFSTVAVAILPLLLGITIDYAIHMIYRYKEERSKGYDAGKSAVSSIKTTGTAVFLTAATTMIGFGSWLTSDLPPLRDFGFLSMLGIFLSFVFVVTLLPAFWVIRDRKKGTERAAKVPGYGASKKAKSAIDRGLIKIAMGAVHHSGKVAITAGIITVIAILLATQTTTAISFEEFMPAGVESVETSNEIEEYFGGQDPSSAVMVLVEGDITDPATLGAMIQLEQQTLSDTRNTNITSSYSIADLILVTNNGSLPENSENAKAILGILRQQMPERTDVLITSDNGAATIMFMGTAETDADLKLIADIVRTNVDQVAPNTQAEFAVGGMPAIAADLLGKISESAITTTLIAFVLCALVLCFIFRSPVLGLITMIPVTLALIWEFGALYVFGIPLNIMTVLISALLIGIGIDFSIHITHRYMEEWKDRLRKPEESVGTSVFHVGRAILVAAASTCGAFGIIMLSGMPMLGIFGGIMALVIILCMLAALFVLPSILVAYARRAGRKRSVLGPSF